MEADATLAGRVPGAEDINRYMRQFGFDYTENPNCTVGYGGASDGVHGDVELIFLEPPGRFGSISTSIRSWMGIVAAPARWTGSATR